MKTEDIQHLAQLSRIALSDDEAAALSTDISKILDYVSVVSEIAGAAPSEQLTPRYNVARADEVTNEPSSFTETFLAQAPKRKGDHLEVKKILSSDD